MGCIYAPAFSNTQSASTVHQGLVLTWCGGDTPSLSRFPYIYILINLREILVSDNHYCTPHIMNNCVFTGPHQLSSYLPLMQESLRTALRPRTVLAYENSFGTFLQFCIYHNYHIYEDVTLILSFLRFLQYNNLSKPSIQNYLSAIRHKFMMFDLKPEALKIYTSNSVTQGQIRSSLETVLTYLKLPPKFITFHSFRRSGVTLAFNNEVSLQNLKVHGGWRSDAI